MALYEISFRFQHACPFNNLSKKYPNVVFSVWCNFSAEFVEMRCRDIELFNELQQDLAKLNESKHSRILHSSFDDRGGLLVSMTCVCNRRTAATPVIEDSNCLLVPPIVYLGGWENYRIIGFEQESIAKLFNRLDKMGELEIVSRKPVRTGALQQSFVISLGDLFAHLTEKQLNALMHALEAGYYRLPKRVTTERIAQMVNAPRTTYEEHMRKAESKVMSAIAPYVFIYARTSAKGRT